MTHFYQANGDIVEDVDQVDRLTKHHQQYSNIILDTEKKSVVRCMIDRMPVVSDFDTLLCYLKTIHPDDFNE